MDRGSWGLSSDLSLEALPPFSSLSQHQAPNVENGDLPFSRLLDPRWAELALSHLKDQEDYVSRRRNLGKKSQVDQEDSGAASPKKAPKYKAKAKAAAAAEDQ